MKTILSLSSVLMLAICFTSCVKTVEISTPENNTISGSWYVSDASYYDKYGWYSYDPGLPGIFSFYNNGTAQYADNIGNMQGYWYSNIITTGYYDRFGDYRVDSHKDFSVSVSGGGYIDLVFDDISFAGNNRFIATYYDGKSIQRYTFTRY
ncbi:MAG TPA: hypothetical protein VFW07_03860 [Parafilimonas sp.]|nr:hypothetical protein [Parafilimonas sp.]